VLLAAADSFAGPVALVTLTAPGSSVVHSADEARRWNRSLGRRARALHDAASRRALRETGCRPMLLWRIAQRQRRGLDHLHVGLAAWPWCRRANEAYVRALRELGPRHGFGWVDDPYRLRHPRGRDGRPNRSLPRRRMVLESAVAGRYLVRYLTESSQFTRLVTGADRSVRPLWVSAALMRASGVTMRRLRRVRHAFRVLEALRVGSRPRMPVWWVDVGERWAVLQLVRLQPRAP
jgi:hypothetical protein